MRYVGNKTRIAKEILPIILNGREEHQWYIEPFVGAFGSMQFVDGNRYASDVNPYIIALMKAIRDGWEPPSSISEQEYNDIKSGRFLVPDHLNGFVGFGCSFGGKWFGGLAKTEGRNLVDESRRNLLKLAPKLQGCVIESHAYNAIEYHSNSIIYCDPPYQGTTKYKGIVFDHVKFWDWVRVMSSEGHKMFVSEYLAPDDFECIWEKEIISSLDLDTGNKRNIEKLFIPK